MRVYHKQLVSETGQPDFLQQYLESNLDFPIESIMQIAMAAKQSLMAMSIEIGRQVLVSLMEQELTDKVGSKGKHRKDRKAHRNGYEDGSVILGDGRLPVKRPRARTFAGEEVALDTYNFFNKDNPFNQAVFAKMLMGVSCRDYAKTLNPLGANLELRDVSRNAISRRFIEATTTALEQLQTRSLADIDLVAMYMDGIHFGKDYTIIAALGVDVKGYKHILGLWDGATENATVCTALLTDLRDRGLNTEKGLLAVIDGSKALSSAIKNVLGNTVLIQRCQIHKMQNVIDHLPKNKQEWVRKKLRQAWNNPDPTVAKQSLENLASSFEKSDHGAAASIREGLDETLTLARLGIHGTTLYRSLKCTNAIESAFEILRHHSRNVKNWRNSHQVLRWAAAGALMAEEKFIRIKGYREIPLLRQAIQRVLGIQTTEVVASA